MVTVTEIRLKYFDTTPIASSMCVLKTGFLFVASEFGNQYVLMALKYA
jgi:splicing factor 3B subunit 3